MSTFPPQVIESRQLQCRVCSSPCAEYMGGQINHADPCAACPRRIWHAWGMDCRKVTVVADAPALPQMTMAGIAASVRWVKAGMPLVSREVYRQRLTLCRACPHWQEGARLGLGKCNAPGCGCTRLKLRLATEQCPLAPPRWGRVNRPARLASPPRA